MIDGEIVLEATDIGAGGFGFPWSHSRYYSNSKSEAFNQNQGLNWGAVGWLLIRTSPYDGSSLMVDGDLRNIRFFKSESGQYVGEFGDLAKLTHVSSANEFHLLEPDGTLKIFNDLSATVAPRQGYMKKFVSPGGLVLDFVPSGSYTLQIVRTYTSGSDTTKEFYDYVLLTSGENMNMTTSVKLTRQVNSGPVENILKVEYTYYSSTNQPSFGDVNALETAKRYEWKSGAWQPLDSSYYRYWLKGQQNDYPGLLKYVVNPESFEKMTAAGHNPLTASDAIIAQYADYYFEYDGQHRASREITDGGSQEFTFTYTDNSSVPPDDNRAYNWWFRKSVMTRPDGATWTVFSNKYGNAMLEVLKSGTDKWYTFRWFDDEGRPKLVTDSAAVTGYDEAYTDLLGYSATTNKFEYLSDTEGMLQGTVYYTSTGSGAAKGYVHYEALQHGQDGGVIKLKEYQYTEYTNGTSGSIFPVSKEILYPSDSVQTTTIETNYSYTFQSGQFQIQERTTTLPAIPTSQQGSGTSNSFVDVYDTGGNRTWHKDERGFITKSSFDIPTGAITQRIDDVDTSTASGVPSGWTTPAGGGLNLVTDFEHDDRGRITQELGPAHTVDLNGTATEIRTATWTVFNDIDNIVMSANGYRIVSSASDVLVNPVSITIRDRNGNVTQQIEAVRASTSGKLQPTDTFAQSSYVRWTTRQYTECCLLESTRVYHTIPASGDGTSGTNYDQTSYGYDDMNRRNRVQTPGGTITFSIYDVRNLITAVYVGTNDTGATQHDPTGGGATGNNMVVIAENEYDGGVAGLDGNLTEQTQHVDSSTSRVTGYGYDWRNRQTVVDGEIDFYQTSTFDNLNRLTRVDRYNTDSSGDLIGRSETKYDDLSRVYQMLRYGVNPNSGSVGNAIIDYTWYDPAGNVMKSIAAGAKLATKTTHDSLNRPAITYQAYDSSSEDYSESSSVTDDTVYEQTERTYDDASNVIQVVARQRYHNATGTGELQGPTGTEPKARVTYFASWPDGIGRIAAAANYGTNGGSTLSRPGTAPASSDTVLVSSTSFRDDGLVNSTTDAAGMITRFEFDDAGRQTKLIENDQASGTSSSSSSSSSDAGCPTSDDVNRTTVTTYTPDGAVATLTAWNTSTGNQTTTYTYGTTLSDSAVASSTLLRSVAYPDSASGSDVVAYTYNRQGQQTTLTDQNGTVHTYEFDLLGRMTHDRVTTLGTGVDGAVRRLSTTYEVRGLPQSLTSHDAAAVGTGSVLNEVKRTYNNFGQVISSQQAHGGGVSTITPTVGYSYADGSNNGIELTGLTYPNGRELTYGYQTGLGRVTSITTSAVPTAQTLVNYSYLGLSAPVLVDYTQTNVVYTLVGTGGGVDPDTGDIYKGLDRFGRVKDCRWGLEIGSSFTDLARIQYGYNRVGSRIWRKDPVAAANSAEYDELYAYDGLQRLSDMQRGTLNSTKTALTSETFAQCWTLDATGNWGQFRQDDDGNGVWNLEQTRTANPVNEITGIGATTGPTWVTPEYDPAGNMTTIPQPADPTARYTAVYDAWNRIVRLTDEGSASSSSSSSSSGEPTLVAEYEYDARGFRIRSTEGSEATRDVFYTETWQAIEERIPPQTFPWAERQYIWGVRYVDDLVLRSRFSLSSIIDTLYAVQDANWNVVAITDDSSAGAVQERYSYTSYGEPTFLAEDYSPLNSSQFGWQKLFTGLQWDQNPGLTYARNRSLAPQLGSWIVPDPSGYVDGMSLYAATFVPNRVDPFGRFAIEWIGPWTPAQQKTVTDGLSAISAALTGRVLPQLAAELKRLEGVISTTKPCSRDHCVAQKMKDALTDMQEVFNKVKDGIAGTDEINFRNVTDPKRDAPMYHSPSGPYWDENVYFNNAPGKGSTPWAMSHDTFLETLFHELTHEYGTEDDYSAGPMMNAHRIDGLINSADLTKSMPYSALKHDMNSECAADNPYCTSPTAPPSPPLNLPFTIFGPSRGPLA